MAIQGVLYTIVKLSKMFTKAPHPEDTTTTVATAVETERPQQTNIKRDTGSTNTTSTVPKVVPACSHIAGMVYVSTESIQDLV